MVGWILSLEPGNGGVHVAMGSNITDLWSRVVSPWGLRPCFSGALSAEGQEARELGGLEACFGSSAKIRRGLGQQPAVTVDAPAGSITCGQPADLHGREGPPTTPSGALIHWSQLGWNVSPEQCMEQCQLTCEKRPSKPSQSHRPLLLPPTGPLYSGPASPMKQGINDGIVSALIIEPHGIMSIIARYCSLSHIPITPVDPSLPLAARKYLRAICTDQNPDTNSGSVSGGRDDGRRPRTSSGRSESSRVGV